MREAVNRGQGQGKSDIEPGLFAGGADGLDIRGIKGRAARGEAKARGGHLSSTPNTISLTPAESLFVVVFPPGQRT